MAAVVKEECVSMDSALKDTLDEASFCTSSNDKSEDGLITPALSASRKMLCQVCGALSSGLHFGVFTCEGCKCFYRRSIKEGANYACAKDRNCDITMETRNSCRFCRFQKCLALGMSKEGIKLGRRPKVDSDVFQQGYYHPGDMEMLHSHGQQYSWPGADHLGTHYPTVFKSEPTATDIESHGKQPVMNYSLKREAYTTCDQHNGLHYSHHAGYLMPSQQPDVSVGMPSPGQEHYEQIYGTTMECVHPQQQVYLPPDAHSHHHHQVPMSNPVPIMNPPAQTAMEHHDTSRSWTAELSPSSSISSASEDAWEAGSMFQSNLPSSVTLTLPEVHSGAVAAMAYANLYRGKNESPSSTSSSLSAAERLQEDECSPSKKSTVLSFPIPSDLEKDSRSYTELVPRKNIQESSSKTLSDEATVYANNLQAVHSALALSPKPASPACSNNNNGEAWVEHDRRQHNMKIDPAAILLDLAQPQGQLKMEQEGVSTGDIQGDESLLHDITAYFLELKMNILGQWKTHCSEVSSHSEALDISWEDVGSFVNTDRTIANHVRCFVNKVLSLVHKRSISGVELMYWNSLSVVVKTCLLLDISTKGHSKVTGGRELPHLLTEEAACICILTLFSSAAVTGKDAHITDACQWICQAAQDYLREKCETEERFQEVIQLLQGESTLPLITSSA